MRHVHCYQPGQSRVGWRPRVHIQNTLKSRPGISFNLGTHEPPEQGDSKAMGLAQWLLNLRILHNCYSIIGVRKVATSANCEAMRCSWQVVSHFVDTLTDLATANIPGTKMRPTTGVLQLAELNLRTRVVELLRLGAEGGCLTFDDAFTSQKCCKTFIATSSSETCRRQPHFRSPGATENRFPERGTSAKAAVFQIHSRWCFICPDYNTRGCSPNKCWYKSLNAVHCLRRLGLLQRTPLMGSLTHVSICETRAGSACL